MPAETTADTKVTKTGMATHLIAGGSAGFMEALVCHPLDTIKVRMQLSRRARMPGSKPRGFLQTGKEIVKRESPLGLYKGLGAVVTGIVPKMAIRFSSFEVYKTALADPSGKVSTRATFLSGLLAGVTEAVAVVTPMEVVKIRLQAQHHSMSDPLDVPRYRNAAHCAYTIVREEGIGALYKGVALTAIRQATNQAVNFTAYQEFRKQLQNAQPELEGKLPSWQSFLIGGVSGAMGPLSNAPIDTIKTRIQRGGDSIPRTGSAFSRFMVVFRDLLRQEGPRALYKGIGPRILRVAPGQAVTFAVYEKVKGWIDLFQASGSLSSMVRGNDD